MLAQLYEQRLLPVLFSFQFTHSYRFCMRCPTNHSAELRHDKRSLHPANPFPEA
jgi:hypothetical protein